MADSLREHFAQIVFIATASYVFLLVVFYLVRRNHFPLNTQARCHPVAVLFLLAILIHFPYTELTGPDVIPCWLVLVLHQLGSAWGCLGVLYAYLYMRTAGEQRNSLLLSVAVSPFSITEVLRLGC